MVVQLQLFNFQPIAVSEHITFHTWHCSTIVGNGRISNFPVLMDLSHRTHVSDPWVTPDKACFCPAAAALFLLECLGRGPDLSMMSLAALCGLLGMRAPFYRAGSLRACCMDCMSE